MQGDSGPRHRCGKGNGMGSRELEEKQSQRVSVVRGSILFVEDEKALRMTVGDRLRNAGYTVKYAFNGDEAFEKAIILPFDLILLDIMLPRRSGFDVCRDIRRAGLITPILVLTARNQTVDKVNGLKVGADDYVTKPIDFDVLAAIVTARLAHVARTDVWARDVQLNDREVETLTWVARGKTSAEIAKILSLTKRTVDFHVDNARIKLGVSTRTQAAIKAVTGKLIEP